MLSDLTILLTVSLDSGDDLKLEPPDKIEGADRPPVRQEVAAVQQTLGLGAESLEITKLSNKYEDTGVMKAPEVEPRDKGTSRNKGYHQIIEDAWAQICRGIQNTGVEW